MAGKVGFSLAKEQFAKLLVKQAAAVVNQRF